MCSSTAAGCHCQHYGSTGLEPETVCQQYKRVSAHSISCNIDTTELPESFHIYVYIYIYTYDKGVVFKEDKAARFTKTNIDQMRKGKVVGPVHQQSFKHLVQTMRKQPHTFGLRLDADTSIYRL